jgi:hypothetical protein
MSAIAILTGIAIAPFAMKDPAPSSTDQGGGKLLFFVHKSETSETIEFADPGFAEIRRDFCTPP